MSRCPGCGGVIGIDCFNPQECVNIGHAIEEDHIARREQDYSQQIESLQKQLETKDQELSRLKVIAEKMAALIKEWCPEKVDYKDTTKIEILTAYAEFQKEK